MNDEQAPAELEGAQAATGAGEAPPETAAQGLQPVNITCTRGFPDWLLRNNVSLAFTSYQTGRLYLVGVDSAGQTCFPRALPRPRHGPMGRPAARSSSRRCSKSGASRTCFPASTTAPDPDRHYVPRVAHTTGDLDIHDIGVMADGRIVFVNSLFSCLATLSPTHGFRVYWKPPFISKLAAEDRCHLNGLAMKDGAPAYVTATSRSDVVNGWRNRRAEGGTLVDVATNAIVTEKLSMPHSPRWHDGRLWLLNSGTGYLGTVDLATGVFEPLRFLPGVPARARVPQRPRHRRAVVAARRLVLAGSSSTTS